MTIRNFEDMNLEDITEDYLLDECIEMGQELGVDVSQGSIYRDAAEGHILRAAKFFDDLRQIKDIISIQTCTGDVLDEYLLISGMARNPPEDTSAKYYVDFDGAYPEIGDLMMCDGFMFALDMLEDKYVIVSVEKGTDMNNFPPGLPVIPEQDVDNLISATLMGIAEPAVDAESDESARERLLEKVSGPAENGNQAEIRAWCESISGCGCARIIPLWNGPNTVLGVIISTDGGVPNKAIVEAIQKYIDPGCNGMGEGKATIGCFFTAVAAQPIAINISVAIDKSNDITYSDIKENLTVALRKYLKDIALHSDTKRDVRYNSVGAILSQLTGVIEYGNLQINGIFENVSCTEYQIPVIGEVEINELI